MSLLCRNPGFKESGCTTRHDRKAVTDHRGPTQTTPAASECPRGVCAGGGGLGRNGVRESSIEGGDLKSTRGRRGRPRVKSGGHPKGEDLWLVEQRDGRNESEVSLWLLGQGIYI